MRKVANMKDVVEWGLCTGCGGCYYACHKNAVELINHETVGIRPVFNLTECLSCNECLSFCPGYTIDSHADATDQISQSSGDDIGNILEIWEGYAVDEEIRYNSASGGVISALALYCLTNEDMDCIVHPGMDGEKPWLNKTFQSKTREELLLRSGSRYSPTSPCDSLHLIENADNACVFIGKPCDVAAVASLRKKREKLDANLGLVLTHFCAGMPSTAGTLDLIDDLGVPLEKVETLRYRGRGWPGKFSVDAADDSAEHSFPYLDAWSRLTRYCSFRCRLCPDGLGMSADISCGDAWHSFGENRDQGRSLVLVRTKKGQRILRNALELGYIKLTKSDAAAVLDAQKNLVNKYRNIFGRIMAMKLFLVPTPRYKGYQLLKSWRKLSFKHKVKSVLGTMKRIVLRKLWMRRIR